MVRETRHLWVGNLPDNVREERIREHFQRYGRVQSVKLLARSCSKDEEVGSGGVSTGYCAAVAFMDIKSAAKAHASENSLDDRCLVTDYYEPLLGDQGRTPGSTTTAGLGSNTPSGICGGGGSAGRSSHLINSSGGGSGGGGGGYDRPSSHYFERRNDPDGSGAFLRRQGPVNHHYRDRPYRNTNGPFVRDTGGERNSGHFRSATGSAGGPSPGSWNSYEPTGPPLSRYPPPDYGGGMDERSERMSQTDLLPSTPTTGKRTAPTPAGLSSTSNNNTPLSARKRKSSRSPSRSRSRSDSRTPPSSSRSRSRSHSPASSASVPSRSRSRSTSGSRLRSRTLSPGGSSSRSSSPQSATSRTNKTPRSAQSSSSPRSRSSRSSQGSSRSPGWLSSSAGPRSSRSSRHRLSGGGGSTALNTSSPAGQLCHSAGSTGSTDCDRRPLAICVRNLPLRSSDTSLKDGLFHEYKKHGKVVTVKVAGQGSDRVAIVRFKKAEDVDKALEVSRDKLFFGCKIEVTPWDSGLDLDDNEFRPLEADLDEYHPKATRTLFIGNLEKDVTATELRASFETFGPIIEIDIKKQSQGSSSGTSGGSAAAGGTVTTASSGGSGSGGPVGNSSSSSSSSSSAANNNNNNNNAYAFCQYADIASVVRAMRHLDGEQVGNTRVKLGFGKSMPTNCVWLHGVAETVAEKFLARHMSRFGHVSYAAIDRERFNGLVFYDQVSCAQAAVQELRGRALAGRKLQVDFASRECQAHFFELVEREPRSNSSSSAAAAALAVSSAIQHRLPSATTPSSSGRTARTPSCSSRSSTHSKERTGSSSSRSRHGGNLSRDESLERDAEMKDLTGERDTDLISARRCSRSPSPCEKAIHRHPSVEAEVASSGSPFTLLERERTRRYGSGGSSSSSGLSMDTGSATTLPTVNGSDVFTRIRDLSEERVDGVASSSGEDEEDEEEEEQQISDVESRLVANKSVSSACKKSKKKKSKLSGSSDSGVSDVSTNEPLPSSIQQASSLLVGHTSSLSGGSSALSTVCMTSQTPKLLQPLNRPSRRVSRLSTDSSGDGTANTTTTKHSLPRIIPWEVETPSSRKSRQQEQGCSRPGTPLCDENDEPPTDPRKERPARVPLERPIMLPLPRFGLELNLSGCRVNSCKTVSLSCSSSASASGTPSSSDGTFRIPHPHGTSVSPSRGATVPGSPRGGAPESSQQQQQLDSSSDSECSSGSSPRASLSTAAVSLAEQLRQWEQRYEQWSSRAAHSSGEGPVVGPPTTPTAQPVTTVATVSVAAAPITAAERYRTRKARPMSLEELKSQEPSDIVRCLLAKHSVFDEDLKRLESSGRETTATTPTVTSPAVNKEKKLSPVVNHVSVPASPTIITSSSNSQAAAKSFPPATPPPAVELIKSPAEPSPRTPSPFAAPPLPKESPPPSPSPPPPPMAKEEDVARPAEPMDEDFMDETDGSLVIATEEEVPEKEETRDTVNLPPPPPPPPLPLPVDPTEAKEPSHPPLPDAVTVETPAVETPLKPSRISKHPESSSKSSSSRDVKSSERSRHSSSSSHRKEKSSSSSSSSSSTSSKDSAGHKPQEIKIETTTNDAALARRKSRESSEQQATTPTCNDAKRRRNSVDAGTPSSKRVKSEKVCESREKEKSSKTYDKENKETTKTPKSESGRRDVSKSHCSSTPSLSKKSKPELDLSSLSLSKPSKLDAEKKPARDDSDKKSSKSSSGKKDKKDKERDKDRTRKREEEREREKRKEEEREKRKEEEREKKKEEEMKLKEFKAKHQSPASSSTSHRRRSEGERIKSCSKMEHSSRKPAIQPPRQSLPSRKKSHSDSDSSSSSSSSNSSVGGRHSDDENHTSLIRSGSKASSDDDSDSNHSNDQEKADRELAEFLQNEPTYFSMYDKVKARSLKLQQQKRQEEERKTVQQQQQDKFCALRQARLAGGSAPTSKRDKDGKKIVGDSSDSDSDSPVRSNRPRPVATASLLSKLSSSSSDDSEPIAPPSKFKDFLFDQPEPKSVKSRIHPPPLSNASHKSKHLLSSSDSDSEPEIKPTPKPKVRAEPTAAIAKRRPSVPEVIQSKSVAVEIKRTVDRSNSVPVKKIKKESSSKLHHSNSTSGKLSSRGEEKMENIFGPLSDDSDDQQKIARVAQTIMSTTTTTNSRLQVSVVYSSDSDSSRIPPAPKQESLPSPPLTDKTDKNSDRQRKKKSKESRTRDRKKSGSKESVTTETANHHHKNRPAVEAVKEHSDGEELQEAGRALESKLMEDSLIAIAHLAQKEKDKKEAELKVVAAQTALVVEQQHKKKKKKSKKTHREDGPPLQAPPPVTIKMESGLELPSTVTTALTIKTEPNDVCPAPIASSSPRVKHVMDVAHPSMDHPTVEPKLSMPSLLWEPSTSPVMPTPPVAVVPIAVSAEISTPAPSQPAARPGIWKQETEDAVAGLLTETFDDFKEEKLDEEAEEPVETTGQSSLIQPQWPPEQEESPQPNEEAQKAIQSLQCEDDLDISDEMIIDEAGTSSTEDTAGPTECPLYSGSSSSDVVEVESQRTARLAGVSKPAAVETAPTPPPSPPELCIDETRCQPENESSPRKELPRTPDIDLSSKSPRTPDLDLLDRSGRPNTPDLHLPTFPVTSNAVIKCEPHIVAQSPSKQTKKPRQPSSNRGGPRRVRGRGTSDSSRGFSESSLEGHDADVYEFYDTEEEVTPMAAPTVPTIPVPPPLPPPVAIPAPFAAVPIVAAVPETIEHKTEEKPAVDLVANVVQEPTTASQPMPRKDLEGLKGRLITTIDDTIETVVRGHHHSSAAALAAAVMLAAPSSPRIQSPRASYVSGPVPQQRTIAETPGPAVMKVELPQPLKETANTLIDPVTGHLTPIRRHDDPLPTQHAGVVVRRTEETVASPSTVVLNLRSGSAQASPVVQHPTQTTTTTPVIASLVKVPSPSNLSVAVTTTSLPVAANLPAPVVSQHGVSSSSVTIIPTSTPASTILAPMQSTEVARLPSATVVTPVPARPATSSGLTFPAVPLTRDAPAHGLLLQQQQQMQQQQQQVQPAAGPIQQQQTQQPPSHTPQLHLPAGVPVSLSGGATVIAVASSGRVSGPTPLLGRQTNAIAQHSMQSQSTIGSTVVIARASGPPQQPASRSHASMASVQAVAPTLAGVPSQAQRPPPAVVTLYSSGAYSSSSQPGPIVSTASLTQRTQVSSSSGSTGSSVSVLPATSRPPLTSSTTTSSGVSVYPIYGPRSESISAPSTVTSTPPVFGSPLATAPIRVSVTSVPTSRATLSATVSTPYRPVYAPNEPPSHHFAAYQHHLVQQQHSPNISAAETRSREEPARQVSTPSREETEVRQLQQQQIQQQLQQQPIHPSMLRELRTPPPAHQHSPSQTDMSRVTPQILLQHQLYQQFYARHHPDFARMGTFSPGPTSHALNPAEAADLQRDPRERPVPPSLPSHLRALAAGGEHRTTESPLQGCVAVPFTVANTNQQQLYQQHHRPSSSGSAYHQTPAGHMQMAPPSPSHQHRQTHVYTHEESGGYHPSPPPAHLSVTGVMQRSNPPSQPTCEAPSPATSLSVRPPPIRTPPHASQVPPQADSLVSLLQRYPIMWQGLMALKNDHAVVQMHFISGNPMVARGSLPCSPDGLALPLRIAQRMRLEQQQLEGVARKVQMEQEHCILLALPCGRDAMDVLQQSNNLRQGFITYLQLKQAAGIVNIAAPGSQQPSYVVHIFPACEFANDSLARITPDLLHRVTDIAHLLVIIATV